MNDKALVHGHWIYDNDQWRLAIYPIVTLVPFDNKDPICDSFVLGTEATFAKLGPPGCAIRKILDAPIDEPKSVTIINLGTHSDSYSGADVDMYIVTPLANVIDGPHHSSIRDEGYMYVTEYELDPDDEDLDKALIESISRLEAPHQVTCNPKG